MKRFLMTLVAVVAIPSAVAMAKRADQAKNLQVLPKTTPIAEIKKLMKEQAKSLGVQCDHCHDTDDFSKDTEGKKTGRWMMTLTGDINKKFGGKQMVTCGTCHNGHQLPPMGGPDLEKDRAKAGSK